MPIKEKPTKTIQTPDFFVHPTASILGPVEIGKGSVVGPYAVIYGNTKIGASTYIGTGSVIGEPVRRAEVQSLTAVGDSVYVGAHVVVPAGAIIFDGSPVPNGMILRKSIWHRVLRPFRRLKVGWQKV